MLCADPAAPPQISLDTTIDLVMRLLDDIDGGAPITAARTAHLRNMLLRTEGISPVAAFIVSWALAAQKLCIRNHTYPPGHTCSIMHADKRPLST